MTAARFADQQFLRDAPLGTPRARRVGEELLIREPEGHGVAERSAFSAAQRHCRAAAAAARQ